MLQAGDRVRLQLRGKRGTYEVEGVAEGLNAAILDLRLTDSRLIKVPLDVIITSEVRENGLPAVRDRASVLLDEAIQQRESSWCDFIVQRVLGHGRNISVQSLDSVREYVGDLVLSEVNSEIRTILLDVAHSLDLMRQQWLERTYVTRAKYHDQAQKSLAKAGEACGIIGLTDLRRVLGDLAKVSEADQEAFQKQANAHVHLVNVDAGETHHVSSNGKFEFTVGVSTDPHDPPIEQVQVQLRDNNFIRAGGPSKGPDRLNGGDRGEYTTPLIASAAALTADSVTFALQIKYRRHDGGERLTPQQRMEIKLQPAHQFSQIVNPYARFSGGAVVDDREMLFGREELLDRMVSVITQGSSGQCFVLYGQKRTGKSSVLRYMGERLKKPFLPIHLSLGRIDTDHADVSFIQQCVDALYIRLVQDFAMRDLLDSGWPNDQRIAARPLESFRRAFIAATAQLAKTPGWRNCRPVLLIDEFTYMYEYIQEERADASFMRQWKALLETGLFSAVIVGQDSMPKFKLAFPNEFAVTHDERISYLGLEDARSFAEKPIPLPDDSSRFRGLALERLIHLTAGHPFFQMIFCDRLVRYLNETRNSLVVEGTVDRVLSLLCSGETALPLDRFDSLITAAGESVADAPRAKFLNLLFKIAIGEGSSSAVDLASLDLDDEEIRLLHDLTLRQIVAKDALGRIRIRVALFAEWLRHNADGCWIEQ